MIDTQAYYFFDKDRGQVIQVSNNYVEHRDDSTFEEYKDDCRDFLVSINYGSMADERKPENEPDEE